MKMKIRFLVLLTVSLSVVVPCYSWDNRASGGGRYVDLQDFVEKYVRDDITRTLDGFNEKWGFVDVKLSDARLELEPDFVGHIEKVTCKVTLIPKRGVQHYIPVSWTVYDKEKGRELSNQLGRDFKDDGPITNVLSSAWTATVYTRKETVRDVIGKKKFNVVKAPIAVPVKDFTGMFTARVYRAKDGEGVYRAVKKSDLQHDLVRYSSESDAHFLGGGYSQDPFGDSLMTGDRLKELGGVSLTDDDGVRAVKSAFALHTTNFTEAFTNLVAAADEYKSVVGDAHGSRFVGDRLDVLRRQKVYPAQECAERAIGEARKRLRQAQRQAQRSEYAARDAVRARDHITRNLALAEESYRRSVARVETERAKLAEWRASNPDQSGRAGRRTRYVRQAEADVQNTQKKMDAMRQKLEACEAGIVATRQEAEKAAAECAAAETELKKIEADQAAQLKAVSEAIANEATVAQQAEKSRLESVIKAAAEKLDNAWQALALPSRSDLS